MHCFNVCIVQCERLVCVLPAFLTISFLAMEFEVECLCACRETGNMAEVVMPVIWFQEVSG